MVSVLTCVLSRAVVLAHDVRAAYIIRCAVIFPLLYLLVAAQVRFKVLLLLVLIEELAGYDHGGFEFGMVTLFVQWLHLADALPHRGVSLQAYVAMQLGSWLSDSI